MSCTFWAGKLTSHLFHSASQWPLPNQCPWPRATSPLTPDPVALPLSNIEGSHLFHTALLNSALTVLVILVTLGPPLAPQCCYQCYMDLKPVSLAYSLFPWLCHCVFSPKLFDIVQNKCKCFRRRDHNIFISLWFFPIVFCAQVILRKVWLLLFFITRHL